MIPDIFHFVYGFKPQTKPFPLLHFLAIQSCLQVNKPQQVIVHCAEKPWGPWWDRLDGRVTVADAKPAPEVDNYRYDDRVPKIYRYAHHADFTRIDALIRCGGIYADIDTIFVRRFPDELRAHRFVAARESDLGGQVSIGNALLASEPNSAFARRWREAMPSAIDGWSDHSTLLPGRLANQHPSEIELAPTALFYPFDHNTLDLMRLLFGDENPPLETISLHLWEHLWGHESRIDFVAFHAGLVTPENIRKVDTTLFRLLRRYLPEDAQ